jgi:hypothetical protein
MECKVTVSAFTAVEADTLEAAIEAVKGRRVVLGGVFADDESEWVIDEADGSPEDISGA